MHSKQQMADIVCAVHGFTHTSYKNSVIGNIHEDYTKTLVRFTVEGLLRYGKPRAYMTVNNKKQLSIEMIEECPDGFNKTDHKTFTCTDRRGVVVPYEVSTCLTTSYHALLCVLTNKVINEDSICCINTLGNITRWPNLSIGGKCVLQRPPFHDYLGICKWMGTINNIECVGIQMKKWISNEYNGYCKGIKIFEGLRGHSVFLRACDIEMGIVNTYTKNGLIDITNIYYARKCIVNDKEILKIERKIVLTYKKGTIYEVYDNEVKFGIIKWIGTINKETCVGLELDYPCEGAMDGIICCSESFVCEPGHGVVCPIMSVAFDYYGYSVEFTVTDAFNIDCDLVYQEDWDQKIVKEKQLKINSNIFVHIEKNNRIVNIRGVLKWCGYVQGVSVGILEMDANFPITEQQKITTILNDVKPVAYTLVHTDYLFRYKELKPYKKTEEDIVDYDLGNLTEYGTVKWRGLDDTDQLYYGFETEAVADGGTNGAFSGQQLFQCSDGCGVLISADTLRRSSRSKLDILVAIDNTQAVLDSTIESLVTLVTTIATKTGLSSNEILTIAMQMDDKSILVPLLNNMTDFVNIYKHPEMVTQLMESRAFGALEISVDKCPRDADIDVQLLRVAAHSLKCGNVKLFEKCMRKCTDKDTLMDNGETFMTHIIKEKVDQPMIILALEGFEFDMTTVNNDKHNPLALACEYSMMDVVGRIVNNFRSAEKSKNVCSICMDRDKTTVFNCGHTTCKSCSETITKCHMCNENITSRSVLYLN